MKVYIPMMNFLKMRIFSSKREKQREKITEKTIEEIISHRIFDKIRGLFPRRKKSEEDLVDIALRNLRQEYEKSKDKEKHIETLREKIFKATSYIPNYNPFLTKLMYAAIKKIGQESVFDKLHITGYANEVLEASRKGRLIILATHNDMFDPVFVVYLFLENGLEPPSFQVGDNLKKNINSFLLQRFNGMFIKRKDITDLDTLLYAKETEYLLKLGKNIVIYPDGTRSRDGKIAPLRNKTRIINGQKGLVKAMKRGFISAILRANNKIKEDIYYTTVTISSPIFLDILEDYQKEHSTGKKVPINAFRKLLNMKVYKSIDKDSGIYVHFTKPKKIPKGIRSINNKPTRMFYTSIIRSKFKKNITVLAEYIMAYTLRYLLIAEPHHHEFKSDQRLSMIKELYTRHAQHILKDKKINHAYILEAVLDHSFEVALKFYQKLNILSKDYLITNNLTLEYNSNRIQHFFKDDYPLVPEEQTHKKI